MENLISMTDYCQEVSSEFMSPKKPFDKNYWFGKILNYSDFLKQPLELWMFVPCDEDGNVFNLPKKEDCLNTIDFDSKLMDYADAKDNVLFEGFETKKGYADYKEDWLKIDEKYCEGKKVEDLVQFNLQLTQTAIKQLGL